MYFMFTKTACGIYWGENMFKNTVTLIRLHKDNIQNMSKTHFLRLKIVILHIT